MDKSTLRPRQQLFALEYLKDLNATQAAIRAGYSEKTAAQIGERLLRNVEIRQQVQEAMDKRAARTEIDGDKILRELWKIAFADPNELVEHRRTCCRYCYGLGFSYQRTQREMESDRQKHLKEQMDRQAKDSNHQPQLFDEAGGIGYDKRKPPNQDCPECFGEGVGQVFLKDTRQLPPEVRALYAGIKETKEGIEVKMHSKEKAIELLGKHLKLFGENKLTVDGEGFSISVNL